MTNDYFGLLLAISPCLSPLRYTNFIPGMHLFCMVFYVHYNIDSEFCLANNDISENYFALYNRQ